jgi:hypothetical protein
MPYKMTAVVAAKPGTGSTLDIPQSVKDDLEAIYEHLRTNPGTEGYIDFSADADGNVPDAEKLTDKQRETAVKESAVFLRQASSYAKSREAGALKFRVLPSKHLPDWVKRFQIKADLPANGERDDQSKK